MKNTKTKSELIKLKNIRKLYKDKKILNRDRETLKGIGRCHYFTKEHFDRMKFSNKSLDRYLKMAVIEKVEKIDKHSNSVMEVYKLTDYGKGYCDRKIYGHRGSYYSSNGTEHDLRIADVYTKLYESGEKFEWKTENQLQQEFRARVEEIRIENPSQAERILKDYRDGLYSAPDFSYTIESQTIMVEVITNSGTYTESHMEAKESFAQVLNSSVNFIK